MGAILVTGAVGFIGYHVAQCLLDRGDKVVGVDNLNDYYDVRLKEARLARLQAHPGFKFIKLDIADREGMERLFEEFDLERVVHLAAQAGVRYSLTHPHVYIHSNIVGFLNVLEGCRHRRVKHLVFASSSSVYGSNTRMPFSVHDSLDHPLSLYAASKKSNELMAHSYAHLYDLPCTGLRFFSVYGPWGRPDMAMFLFTRAILEGRSIDVFNRGQHKRDFTYIDDIVEGVARVLDHIPGPDPKWISDAPDPASSLAPYRLYNIGSGHPVNLVYVIDLLENIIGRRVEKNLLGIQPGDIKETYADVQDTMRDLGFKPKVSIEEGIARFVAWYREFYA